MKVGDEIEIQFRVQVTDVNDSVGEAVIRCSDAPYPFCIAATQAWLLEHGKVIVPPYSPEIGDVVEVVKAPQAGLLSALGRVVEVGEEVCRVDFGRLFEVIDLLPSQLRLVARPGEVYQL